MRRRMFRLCSALKRNACDTMDTMELKATKYTSMPTQNIKMECACGAMPVRPSVSQ